MDQSRHIRRFRANPVEVAIFSIITLVFVNSLYNLVYEHEGFNPKMLVPMASNPVTEGNRMLATSVLPKTLLNLDVPCDSNLTKDTQANKVRLNGVLCGLDKVISPYRIMKSSIVNESNHFVATVFTDPETGKYSTDYIPLEAGENILRLEFSYSEGKAIAREVSVNRLTH